MGKALLLSSQVTGAAPNSSRYWPMASAELYVDISEASAQIVARIAGTLSKLAASVDAVGTGRSVTVRKNTAAGNQVVSPTDTTAGVYEDASHTDAVAVADLINYRTITSSGTMGLYWLRQIFEAAGNHATYFSCSTNGNYTAASGSRFATLAGTHAPQSSGANTQVKIRAAGIIQNAQLRVSANGRAGNCTAYLRVNGVRTAITMSLLAGTTGTYEDTVNSVAVVSGDLVDWELVLDAGAGTLTIKHYRVALVADSGYTNDIFCTAGGNAVTRAAGGAANYYFIAGRLINTGSEAIANVRHGFQATLTKMRLYLSANTYSSTATAVLRVNGVDTAMTFAIEPGVTGWLEDAIHHVTVEATDDVCWAITGGGTGSITMRLFGLTEYEGAFVAEASSLPIPFLRRRRRP